MEKIILLILLFLSELIISQTAPDTLNKRNKNRNKQGFWLAYLGERLCMVNSKEEAFYYLYFNYDDGYSFDGIFCPRACKSRSDGSKFESSAEKPIKGAPVLLNGNFKTYDAAGRLLLNENFKNGCPGVIEDYNYNKHGKCLSKSVYNFTKKYNNQSSSWFYQQFDADLKLKNSYYLAKNDKGKWVEIK